MSDCYIVRRGGAGGGGEIKVVAVAGESELPSVADGTIAIISDAAVGNVYVQTAEPEAPVTGDVWVYVTSEGSGSVQLGNVIVPIKSASQCIDGAWVAVDTYTVVDGAWEKSFATVLYLIQQGVDCTAVTGGWNVTGSGYYSSKLTDDHRMQLVVGTGSSQICRVTTKNPINFEGYNTLTITASSSYGTYASYIEIYDASNTQVAKSGNWEATLDVSELNDSYYVRYWIQSQTNATINNTTTVTEFALSV